jgi:hypothetical protein
MFREKIPPSLTIHQGDQSTLTMSKQAPGSTTPSTSRASQRKDRMIQNDAGADDQKGFRDDIAQLARNGKQMAACARLAQARGAQTYEIQNLTRLVDLYTGDAKAAATLKLIKALEAPAPVLVLSPEKKRQKPVDLTSDDSPREASASAAVSPTVYDSRFTSPEMESVFNCYKVEGIHDAGLNINYVARRLGQTVQEVRNSIDFLLSEGLVYSTIGPDDYKSVEEVEPL